MLTHLIFAQLCWVFSPCFHVASSPSSRSIIPITYIPLLSTTLPQCTSLQLFLLSPLFALPSTPPMPNFHCTHSSISSATPVMSQVLQPLPHIHLVPIHQVPSPNFTCRWAPSGCLPHPPNAKELSGTLTKVFHRYRLSQASLPTAVRVWGGPALLNTGDVFLVPITSVTLISLHLHRELFQLGLPLICSASMWVAGH